MSEQISLCIFRHDFVSSLCTMCQNRNDFQKNGKYNTSHRIVWRRLNNDLCLYLYLYPLINFALTLMVLTYIRLSMTKAFFSIIILIFFNLKS